LLHIIRAALRKFIQLDDTPNSYSGLAGKLFKVNSSETALEASTNTDSEIAEAVNVSQNVIEKVSEVEVSSDCTHVEFTNLDGNSAWFYYLLSTIKNPTSIDVVYKIFFNGNETDTNYYVQYFEAMGASTGYNRLNRPELTHTKTGHSCGQDTIICRDPQGYIRWFSKISRFNGSEVRASLYCGCSAVTFSNITSIKIVATATGGIGAGSRFVLFKVRRG